MFVFYQIMLYLLANIVDLFCDAVSRNFARFGSDFIDCIAQRVILQLFPDTSFRTRIAISIRLYTFQRTGIADATAPSARAMSTAEGRFSRTTQVLDLSH